MSGVWIDGWSWSISVVMVMGFYQLFSEWRCCENFVGLFDLFDLLTWFDTWHQTKASFLVSSMIMIPLEIVLVQTFKRIGLAYHSLLPFRFAPFGDISWNNHALCPSILPALCLVDFPQDGLESTCLSIPNVQANAEAVPVLALCLRIRKGKVKIYFAYLWMPFFLFH